MAESVVPTLAPWSSRVLALGGMVWLAVVVAGFVALLDYKGTAGEVAHAAPAVWPEASRLPRSPGRRTLVMFVHPQCSCSRASMAELARLLANAGGDLETIVAFAVPDGASDAFASTSLWASAASIEGVRVVLDRGNAEATRFGAATSGHALLYDARGELRFSGGITSARGHEGPSAGQDRLVSLLRTGAADRASRSRNASTSNHGDSAVFGCRLEEDGEARR